MTTHDTDAARSEVWNSWVHARAERFAGLLDSDNRGVRDAYRAAAAHRAARAPESAEATAERVTAEAERLQAERTRHLDGLADFNADVNR